MTGPAAPASAVADGRRDPVTRRPEPARPAGGCQPGRAPEYLDDSDTVTVTLRLAPGRPGRPGGPASDRRPRAGRRRASDS